MKYFFIPLFLMLLISGCSRDLEPIEYGKDTCHWCQMMIVDPQFGAEAITDKGRCYKFDSAECLIHYLEQAEQKHSHTAVTDFENPNVLMDAETSWFLVSEKMPSPMGADLNAFKEKEVAMKYQNQNGGELSNWTEIQSKLMK